MAKKIQDNGLTMELLASERWSYSWQRSSESAYQSNIRDFFFLSTHLIFKMPYQIRGEKADTLDSSPVINYIFGEKIITRILKTWISNTTIYVLY